MGHRADRELAQSLLGGDEREFDRFFREYYPRLYRFVLTRTNGDEDLAEEMAQVTLINAMRALEGYRGDASMFTWLCQICRNELSAQHRRLGEQIAERLGVTGLAAQSLLSRARGAFRDAINALYPRYNAQRS
jgi:RNA polymerase sigma-70 factor (ECF subfamily)